MVWDKELGGSGSGDYGSGGHGTGGGMGQGSGGSGSGGSGSGGGTSFTSITTDTEGAQILVNGSWKIMMVTFIYGMVQIDLM